MANLIQGKWDCSNNETVQKKVDSSSEKDKIETYKILEQKDEIEKSWAV